jgi:hypothetical protein
MKYKLIKKETPTITNGVISNDPDVGGIKLVYEVTTESFRGKDKLHKYQNKAKIVFLKPYKKYWNKDCKKGEWGNINNPLTTIWLFTNVDYKDFSRTYTVENIDFLMSLKLVKNEKENQLLISHLNKQTKEFEISEESKSPKKLSIIKRWRISLLIINQNLVELWQKKKENL